MLLRILISRIIKMFFVWFVWIFQIQGMHSNVATLRKASIWNEASRIIHEEGFRAFWKGNLVTIAHRLPYSSVNFYSYEHYKKVSIWVLCGDRYVLLFSGFCFFILISFLILYVQLLRTVPQLQSNRDNISTDLCIHFVGGGMAGITAATSTYPLDLVRTRLAAQVRFKSSNAF